MVHGSGPRGPSGAKSSLKRLLLLREGRRKFYISSPRPCWTDFDRIQLVSVPLFLFSATFFPLSVLPRWLQLVVHWLPLCPGVALCRGFSLGQLPWGMVPQAAYLAALAIAAGIVGRRRVTQLLTP